MKQSGNKTRSRIRSRVEQRKILRELLDKTRLFDVGRYERCAELDSAGWSACLSIRFLTRARVLGPEKRTPDLSDDKGYHLLRQFLERPIPPSDKLAPLWGPGKPQTVYDVDVYSAWAARSLFQKLPEAEAACTELDRRFDSNESVRTWPPPTMESLHSHCLEKKVWPYRATEPQIFVDLRATDEQIKSQFVAWLKSKREELDRHGVETRPPTRFSSADYRRWHEHRVLAFIDLDMLDYHFGWSLTDDFVGQRLFPDELDVNVGDKVRKTIRPLAQWLMEPSTLDALEYQAGFDWNARLDKAEEKHD